MACLFEFYILLENFSLIWRRRLFLWRNANFDLFDLCSALMANEQGGFFFTACHTYCETGHWPFTMVISYDPWYLHIVTWLKYCRYGVKLYPHNQSVTPIAELLEVELLLPVFTNDLGLSRLWFEHSTFRLRSECSTPDFLNTLRWFKAWSLACCCEILSFTPRNKLQRVKCFWPVRHSLIQSVRQSWFSCQRNSSENAHQKHIHRKFWFNFLLGITPFIWT